MVIFALLITTGQVVVAIGISLKSWPVMYVGRVVINSYTVYPLTYSTCKLSVTMTVDIWARGRVIRSRQLFNTRKLVQGKRACVCLRTEPQHSTIRIGDQQYRLPKFREKRIDTSTQMKIRIFNNQALQHSNSFCLPSLPFGSGQFYVELL